MSEQVSFNKEWLKGKLFHLIPTHDSKPHDVGGAACHCYPTLHDHAPGIILVKHNCFNHREWYTHDYYRLN
jgi:hypothetical protein